MTDVASALSARREMVQQLHSLAVQLERGQAETPLADRAAALLEEPDSALFLVILSLDPQARAEVVTWLIGPQHHSVAVKLAAPQDWVEIRLQERGYSLETLDAGRREFDAAGTFADALANLDSLGTGMVEPIRLALAAPLPLRNLHLLVAPESALLLRSTGILGDLVQRAPILLLARSAAYRPNPLDLQALQMLASSVVALWPIAVGPDVPPLPLSGGKASPAGLALLPPLQLHLEGQFLPDFIVRGPGHPLRQALAGIALARRAASLMDILEERHQTDLRQLQSRQTREARLERSADSGAREQDLKLAFDRYKLQFTDELTKLMRALREGNRRALLKTSPLARTLEELLASLQGADLQREAATKTQRLTLKPEVLEEFRRRLARTLRQQLDEECVLIRDSLEELRRGAEDTLAAAGATQGGLALIPPDNRALWEPLEEMLELDLKYRGEIPRRGFLERLGEGRRVVFVVLMVLSLAGSFVGFNLRQAAWAGVLFLILFIGSVLYTFRAWKRLEQEELRKEIERLRETLSMEINRMLNDILREKLNFLQQQLDEIKREANHRLDTALREAQLNKSQATEAERRDARAKLKLIDQRLRDFQGMDVHISRLRQGVTALGREATAGLGQVIATL